MAPGRRRLGIRGRVVASFLVLLVGAELVSVLVLHRVGTARMEDRADRDLAVAAEALRERLGPAEGTPTDDASLGAVFDAYLRARPARADQAYLAIVDGRPFASSAGAPVALQDLEQAPEWAAASDTRSGQTRTPVGPMRWLAVPVTSGGRVLGVLVTAEFLADEQAALDGTVATVAAVTLLVLVGASLLAWGAAGRALAPLHDLAVAARSVTSGTDLDARIPVEGTDEVATLGRSLNGMLDRLRVAFDSQKQFLDDAGHQLRTPITIVRGHVELLDDDPEARAADVALVLDELDRMDRLVGELRTLARAERPDFLELEELDASELVAELGRKAEAVADRRWVVVTAPGTRVRADRHRLTEAVLDLVENAVQVTAEGDSVELGAARRDGVVELFVRDEGPGFYPDDVPHLFDRTGPRGRHRPGGTGLGLPIVAAIARAHGGDVDVETTPGRGARVAIRLPVAGGTP